jgi:diaminopimelate decarboxylase
VNVSEHFGYVAQRLHCEDVPAEQLAREFGTPLYVYSRAAIENRFRDFASAFAALDPLVAYSVKANGNLGVLRLLGALGAGADIVSGGELHRVLLAGISADRVLFSGVGKTRAEIEQALAADIYGFNVESEGELRVISQAAVDTGVHARMAWRVNPDVEAPTPHHYTRTGHMPTKFGVPWEQAADLYRLASSLPGLQVRGVDVHIGSQILDAAPYRIAIQRVLELVDLLAAEGIALEYIDIGGGFGVAYEGAAGPSAAQFAQQLVPELRGRGLRTVMEPGRFIVGPAGVLLTHVLYVKRMGSKTFVITDAGMNDLLRPSHYSSYHRIEPAYRHEGRDVLQVDVVGPICESGDFLALDRVIERPEPGDLLAISTVGAYGFAMASTYNSRPRPAEVIVDGARALLARRRETYDDLIQPELDSVMAEHAADD